MGFLHENKQKLKLTSSQQYDDLNLSTNQRAECDHVISA